MKKIAAVFSAFMLLAGMASAQTMSDALTFGQNNYYGTARTMAMGNAVTAIGGDLGTISINPAGGAVSAFSQFGLTTGWSTASSVSAFAPSYDSYNENPVYSGSFSEGKTRMTIPNFGMNMYFETDGGDGIKGWNFGMLVNRSQTYTSRISASGREGHTSITGALATAAGKMPGDILGSNSMYDSGYPWNPLCAYDCGLINFNSDAGTYYGSAETVSFDGTEYSYEMLGWLRQDIGTTVLGSKNDIIFNYGFNFNDRLFFGMSLNCPLINYKYSEYYSETAMDPNDFPVTTEYWDNKTSAYVKGTPTKYESGVYKYNYVTEIGGVNAKLGLIWLPFDGLRIGAAFQTPTAYTINERWYIDESVSFADKSQNMSSHPDPAESEYDYRSPYNANFGIAYTFGRSGMVSVDYELTDFSVMRFSESYEDEFYSYDDPFLVVNRLNKLFCGVQHSLRVGAELRVSPAFSVRAGMNLVTSPERHYTDTDGYSVYASDYEKFFDEYESGTYRIMKSSAEYSNDICYSLSCGVGYSSPGSFFADVAVRRTTLPGQYYQAYSNYLSHDVAGVAYDIVSPSVKSARSLFDAVLTIGWRF